MPTGPISRLDIATGRSRFQSDSAQFSVDLEPMEIALFYVSAATVAPAESASERLTERQDLANDWVLSVPGDQHAYAATERGIDPSRGWEGQGLPDFSGVGVYRCHLDVSEPQNARLLLPAVSGSATLIVNGERQGARGWTPFRFDVPASSWRVGDNVIEIAVASTAANRYYAGTGMRDAPEPAGLLARPVIQFELSGKSAGENADA